ncbi:hypothetical protein GTO89_01290 [Heliobacterium gestii]|uniref:Uncharacterized protein n=1 Tax=Heliomicrobium gestii TaxID=2699 RepID=A0A845L8V8_HELGE|nr:hypothetical protein [Heliomicrobium gestii]MBM7865407.1 hypothetical protein [Heliomicrobium gestii]MZP41664.1 hypothetical protein [Heliomicrobium gestii]
MKQKMLLPVLILSLALVAGCNNSAAPTAKANGKKPDTEASANANANAGAALPVPKRPPELVGKVKDIVGNEVTIFKGKMEEPAGERAPEENGQATRPAGERRRSGNENGGVNSDVNSDVGKNNGTRPAGVPRNRMTFTEETETFLIPVGVPIATMQRGSGDAAAAQLTDIKKDQVIRLWKNNDAIEFVQISGGNPGGQRPNAPGAGQAGQGGAGGARGGSSPEGGRR